MANTAQARKRARQAEATRMRNASLKSALRTAVKKVKMAIATGAAELLEAAEGRIPDPAGRGEDLAFEFQDANPKAIKALA